MKKLIVVLVVALLPLAGFSQSSFDKFEDRDNVGTVTISKGMFDLFAKMLKNDDDPEARELAAMAENLDGLKIFMTEDKAASADLKSSMKKYLRSSSLEELMRVKDDETNVFFYIKNGKNDDHVTELLMFVTGLDKAGVNIENHKFETVLLSLTGDIDLAQIGKLTDKMDLPKDLKKANRKGK